MGARRIITVIVPDNVQTRCPIKGHVNDGPRAVVMADGVVRIPTALSTVIFGLTWINGMV